MLVSSCTLNIVAYQAYDAWGTLIEGQGDNAIATLLIFSICQMDAILWLWDDICQKQKEQIMLQRKCFGETCTALNQFSKSHIILNSIWFALGHGKTSANFCESSFVSLSELHDISAIVMFVTVTPWIFLFSSLSMLSLSLQLLVNPCENVEISHNR